jgi:hypothetical protein
MGGGGAHWSKTHVDDLRRELDVIKKAAETSTFSTEVATYLNNLLADANNRDRAEIDRRLNAILDSIKEETEGTIRLTFAGSVAKHTYVDGLSDVDVLLKVNGSELEQGGPSAIRDHIAAQIRKNNADIKTVENGRMAVTITYDDGIQIQLLPALRTASGLKIPSESGKRWSEVDPERFSSALTRANDSLSGKLVPTIKLVKAINGNLPAELQLSGYHIESLALQAFKGYRGTRTPATMLEHFFSKVPELVKTPIKDRTGQSVHVDDDLGPTNSDKRRLLSSSLDRIARRISFATVSTDLGKLQELFG